MHRSVSRVATGAAQRRTVLIADQRPLLRWALSQLADEQPDLYAVVTAATPAEALQQARRHRPQVLVLDGALPQVADGTLLAELREVNPRATMVLLAGSGRAAPSLAARASAGMILPRAAGIDVITEAVRELLTRPHARRGTGRPTPHRRSGNTQRGLSPREQQVLELLRDGLSTPAIAATLQLSMSTAKTYVARLYDKLEATNRAQAVTRAVRLGLLEATDD